MGRASDLYTGVQRMVTAGDVIFVHQQPRQRTTPAPAPSPEAEPEEVPPVAEAAQVWDPSAGETERYTPPPPGYAYEFGSGRLVAIRPDLIRVP